MHVDVSGIGRPLPVVCNKLPLGGTGLAHSGALVGSNPTVYTILLTHRGKDEKGTFY